jgi:DNA repair protein RadC
VTRNLTRTSSITVAGLRDASLVTLDAVEDLGPSAFFTLVAAVDVSERCSEEEEEEEVEVDVEEVERVAAEAD